MFYKFNLLFTLIFSLLLISCKQSSEIELIDFDKESAFEILVSLANIGPRHSGSEGADKTVRFIAEKLSQSSIPYYIDEWEENTPAGKIKFRNLIARIGSPEKRNFIVLGTHYDTKKLDLPGFQGANDGGSGVAILLETARQLMLKKEKLKLNVEIVFFDGEECIFNYNENDGLHGSKRYVQQLKNRKEKCLAAIIPDMLADKDLNAIIPENSDNKLATKFIKTAERLSKVNYFSRKKLKILDDHQPFIDAQIPALLIIDFEYGPNNIFWHSSGDNIQNCSTESLHISGLVIANLIFNLATSKKD